jgi:hypothetical protein
MMPDNPLFQDGTLDRIKFDGTLTKRERFAMAAMQGLSANPDHTCTDYEKLAGTAVKQADALIAALKSTPEPQ